jgi:hypothetical protein
LKTYDVGNVHFCTENQATADLVGYIYVHYDIELFTPQLGQLGSYTQVQGGAIDIPAGTTPSTLFSAATLKAGSLGITNIFDNTTTTHHITIIPPGKFLLSMVYESDFAGGVQYFTGINAVSGCTVSTAKLSTDYSGAGPFTYFIGAFVDSPLGNAVVNITNLANITTVATGGQVTISMLPPSLLL